VSFAKELSKIGDIYINEAFPCSHRAHASIHEITKHMLPLLASSYWKK